MPYTFNCVLTGLCGFVLNKPLASTPTRVRALLPEGNTAAFREELPPHWPMLLIPKKNLTSTGGVDPKFILHRLNEEPIAIYFLSGIELSFDFHGEGQPIALSVDATPVTDPKAPQGNERTSFETIARLDKGAPGAKSVDSGCFLDPPQVPNRNRVDGRVRIDSGKLYVRSLTQSPHPVTGVLRDEIWAFRDPNGTVLWEQVLAEDVVLEKLQVVSSVNLVGKRLNATGNTAFDLQVGPAAGENAAEVTVLNSELEGLFELEIFGRDRDKATDTKLLYRLSTAWDGNTPTVKPLPMPERVLGGIGRPVHCPRVSFVDDPNA